MKLEDVKTPFDFELYVTERDVWDNSRKASHHILNTTKPYSVVILIPTNSRVPVHYETKVIPNIKLIGNKVHVNEKRGIAGCIYRIDIGDKTSQCIKLLTRSQIFDTVEEANEFKLVIDQLSSMAYSILSKSLCYIEHLADINI